MELLNRNTISCEICGLVCKSFNGLSHHIIKTHKQTPLEYYDVYILCDDSNLCIYCKKPVKFTSLKNGYKQQCKTESCRLLKYKKTCREKYGVDNSFKSEKIKNIIKEKLKKNYGVDNPTKNKNIMDKIKKTKKEKHGNENYNNIEKQKNTIRERYKVTHYSNTKEYKEKCQKTSMMRYGTKHPMQNEEIFNNCMKSSYNWKLYVLPSGKEIKTQGYENKFLDEYFENGGKEENVVIHPTQDIIGKIWYKNKGNLHKYYPDFYIKNTNTIIEVKSTYTFDKDKNVNLLKEKSCLTNGFNFEFRIYNK